MKLADLLEGIKIGEETFKDLKKSESLTENYDKDLKIYKVSEMIKDLNRNILESLPEEYISVSRKIKLIEDKVVSIEEKLRNDDGQLTQAFSKMKYDSLSEDYKTLFESVKKYKINRQVDSEKLAQVLALTIYEGKKLSDFGNFDFDQNDFPLIMEFFNKTVEHELMLIEENQK